MRIEQVRFEKIGKHTAKETSDRKPVGLPFRLKELRTFACFPVSQQGSINYPPSASRMGPLSLQKGAAFCMLSFY